MMDRKRVQAVLIVFMTFLTAGCVTTTNETVHEEKSLETTGRWNDTDSKLVAYDAIDDCLHRMWLLHFRESHNRKPVVDVGPVVNETLDDIDVEAFSENLKRALTRSGQVKVYAPGEESSESADYALSGVIQATYDDDDMRNLILYQANMELVDLKTNEEVWTGKKYLRKVTKSSNKNN